jgi:hypothetical protein
MVPAGGRLNGIVKILAQLRRPDHTVAVLFVHVSTSLHRRP